MDNTAINPIIDSGDHSLFDIHTRAQGPKGSLPLTPEMLLTRPSGDLFGLTRIHPVITLDLRTKPAITGSGAISRNREPRCGESHEDNKAHHCCITRDTIDVCPKLDVTCRYFTSV